ncbi:MAG TPA: flagellar motor protein MotA, partial [Stellaceae bacterium]|nr:flagellar motor protein MotA [Stellaceae bacterium]
GWTRLSGGTVTAGDGEASVPAFIEALLEQTADNLDKLQRTMGRGEDSRIAANTNLVALTERLALLSEQIRTEQTLLVKLAERQVELKPVLQRLADAGGAPAIDEESRAHLRNIEAHLVRLGEELSQGRGDSVQEIRSEIRLLARTLAARPKEPAAH